MAMEQVIERLRELMALVSPTLDVTSGSPFDTQILGTVRSEFGVGELSLDVADMMVRRLTQFDEDILTTQGSSVNDLLIKVLAPMLNTIVLEIQRIERNQDLNNISKMTETEADRRLSNFLMERRTGDLAIGTVRAYFQAPVAVEISFTNRALTASGLAFFPSEAFRADQSIVAAQQESGLFYVDIPYTAEAAGDNYSVEPGAITQIENLVGVVRVTNVEAFKGGVPKETNTALLTRTKASISERSLSSVNSIISILTDRFPTKALSVIPIGFSDPEMVRDALTIFPSVLREGIFTEVLPGDGTTTYDLDSADADPSHIIVMVRRGGYNTVDIFTFVDIGDLTGVLVPVQVDAGTVGLAGNTLTDAGQDFVAAGVVIGDRLQILDSPDAGIYLISNVAVTVLTVTTLTGGVVSFSTARANVDYTVYSVLEVAFEDNAGTDGVDRIVFADIIPTEDTVVVSYTTNLSRLNLIPNIPEGIESPPLFPDRDVPQVIHVGGKGDIYIKPSTEEADSLTVQNLQRFSAFRCDDGQLTQDVDDLRWYFSTERGLPATEIGALPGDVVEIVTKLADGSLFVAPGDSFVVDSVDTILDRIRLVTGPSGPMTNLDIQIRISEQRAFPLERLVAVDNLGVAIFLGTDGLRGSEFQSDVVLPVAPTLGYKDRDSSLPQFPRNFQEALPTLLSSEINDFSDFMRENTILFSEDASDTVSSTAKKYLTSPDNIASGNINRPWTKITDVVALNPLNLEPDTARVLRHLRPADIRSVDISGGVDEVNEPAGKVRLYFEKPLTLIMYGRAHAPNNTRFYRREDKEVSPGIFITFHMRYDLLTHGTAGEPAIIILPSDFVFDNGLWYTEVFVQGVHVSSVRSDGEDVLESDLNLGDDAEMFIGELTIEDEMMHVIDEIEYETAGLPVLITNIDADGDSDGFYDTVQAITSGGILTASGAPTNFLTYVKAGDLVKVDPIAALGATTFIVTEVINDSDLRLSPSPANQAVLFDFGVYDQQGQFRIKNPYIRLSDNFGEDGTVGNLANNGYRAEGFYLDPRNPYDRTLPDKVFTFSDRELTLFRYTEGFNTQYLPNTSPGTEVLLAPDGDTIVGRSMANFSFFAGNRVQVVSTGFSLVLGSGVLDMSHAVTLAPGGPTFDLPVATKYVVDSKHLRVFVDDVEFKQVADPTPAAGEYYYSEGTGTGGVDEITFSAPQTSPVELFFLTKLNKVIVLDPGSPSATFTDQGVLTIVPETGKLTALDIANLINIDSLVGVWVYAIVGDNDGGEDVDPILFSDTAAVVIVDTGPDTFQDTAQDFDAMGVLPGDFLEIEDGPNAGSFEIESIATDTLTFPTATFAASESTTRTYQIRRAFRRNTSARELDETFESDSMVGSSIQIGYLWSRSVAEIGDYVYSYNTRSINQDLLVRHGIPVVVNIEITLNQTFSSAADAEEEISQYILGLDKVNLRASSIVRLPEVAEYIPIPVRINGLVVREDRTLSVYRSDDGIEPRRIEVLIPGEISVTVSS